MAVDDPVVGAASGRPEWSRWRAMGGARSGGRRGSKDSVSQELVSPDSGSQPDFAAVYRVEVAALVRHVMYHGATAEEAWDAAQTAFADAYRVWSTIRSPRAWLRTVAVRAYLRSAVPETPTDCLPDRPGSPSAALRVEVDEQERLVLRALAGLPGKQRQVMAWSIDGFSPGEIAHVLDEDPAAVRQNLRRARQNLKRQLGISGRDAR